MDWPRNMFLLFYCQQPKNAVNFPSLLFLSFDFNRARSSWPILGSPDCITLMTRADRTLTKLSPCGTALRSYSWVRNVMAQESMYGAVVVFLVSCSQGSRSSKLIMKWRSWIWSVGFVVRPRQVCGRMWYGCHCSTPWSRRRRTIAVWEKSLPCKFLTRWVGLK